MLSNEIQACLYSIHRYLYDLNRPLKLNIFCTGAGLSLANLGLFAGSSKYLNKIYFPYGEDEIKKILTDEDLSDSYVSEKSTRKYLEYLNDFRATRPPKDILNIVINGTVQTNRYKKGNYEAYIGFQHNNYLKPFICKIEWLKTFDEEFFKTGLSLNLVRKDSLINQIRLDHESTIINVIHKCIIGEIYNDANYIHLYDGTASSIKTVS